MRNLPLSAIVLILVGFVLLTIIGSAEATVYPYCASGVQLGGTCSYSTLEQCRAYVNGVGGYCSHNPRYEAGENALPQKRPARR